MNPGTLPGVGARVLAQGCEDGHWEEQTQPGPPQGTSWPLRQIGGAHEEGGALGAGDPPLQPIVRQVVPLQPMEDPMMEQVNCTL